MAITASELAPVLLKVDGMWADNQTRKQFTAKVAGWESLRVTNTAQLGNFFTTGRGENKKLKVKLAWIDACEVTESACTNDCAFGGPELDTNVDEYEIDQCRESKFVVGSQMYENNEFDKENFVAAGILKAMASLDEMLVKRYIAFVDANCGVNVWDGPKWTVSSTNTNVPLANWKLPLMFDFQYAAEQNRMSNVHLLTGYNLSEEIFMANANRNNGEGAGNAALAAQFPLVQDLFNIEFVNTTGPTTTYKTYMIERGAVAFASRAKYGQAPVNETADILAFSRPSLNLDGVRYDVYVKVGCGANGEFVTEYKVKANFGFFLNPLGCDNPTRTGLLKFVQVA